jgi:preprotein translocase subunit SecA
LRGRSGRQGDPGTTQFFVSLEDSIMRIFASDLVKKMMGKIGLKEDEPIENGFLTRGLESAQTKIESMHFDSRKHTLQYDDVLNYQRKIIYDRRRKVLFANTEELKDIFKQEFNLDVLDVELKNKIEDKVKSLGEESFYTSLRRLMLQNIDTFWIDHLEQMDYLRNSVNLRAYGQRDPLVEYKKDGLRLFKEMQQAINEQILSLIPNISNENLNDVAEKMKKVQQNAELIGGSNSNSGTIILKGNKRGRNDKVTVEKDNVKKEIKYKHLDEHLTKGWKEIV